MLTRIFLISMIIAFTCNIVQADGRFIPKAQYDKIIGMQYKIKIVGDAVVGERIDRKENNNTIVYRPTVISLFTNPFTINYGESDFITSATFTPTNGQSIYDLQSNGSPVQLWMNPANFNEVHAVYMTADYNDPSFTNRRGKYYFSTNRGTSWTFITEVPNGVRAGYITVTGMSDGNILVANHSNAGGGSTRAQVFVDIFPGLGSFMRLDPGTGGHNPPPIWPRLTATSSIVNTNKFVLVASQNGDSGFINVGTSLTTPGAWLGWTNLAPCDVAETYAIARGDDGRIGIAFKNNGQLYPNDAGDCYFIESTNHGTTFSTPLKIFDANFSASGDSLGVIRGVSLVYQINSPKAVFGILKQDPTPGTYYPLFPSKIMFWSTILPGSDPNRSIVIADENNVWFPQDSLYQGVNDVFGPICRPVIGRSSDNNALFSAFVVITNRFGAPVDTTNFHAIYLTASADSGSTWLTPVQVTPKTPVMDWVYPSMAPVSDVDANNYYVNMTIQKDTIPGSFVQGATNGPSLAQLIFTRVKISKDSVITGINNSAGEIPDDYNLSQNYPNPFNPETKIKFSIPKTGLVTLKVYDILGREVITLINEMHLPGTYEVTWPARTGNASSYPSGVYFYRVEAGEFNYVRKMVMIK